MSQDASPLAPPPERDDDPLARLQSLAREDQLLLDTLLVGIVFVRDRVVLRCNRRFEETFGYAPGELLGRSTRLLYPDDEAFAIGARPYPQLAEGGTHQREQELVRKDGQRFWCRLYGRAMDPSRPDDGSVWLFEDVSERRAAEEALRRALLQQEAIFENASAGIVFLRDRVILRCNRSFGELLGRPASSLVGQTTRLLFSSDEDWQRAGEAYLQLARGETHAREEELMRADGSRFWCRLTGRAVDFKHPERESVWLFDDITEQRATRSDLERAVRERTAELAAANEQLRREMHERKQVEDRVRHLADHDELTGLPNRRLLLDRLGQALALARRADEQVAVMFLDLDRFKTINDSLGHLVGDELLRAAATRIAGAVRDGDTLARLGGDEFVMILPRVASATHVTVVATKVMEALAQPFRLHDRELHITTSIGIALFPADGDGADTLLRNADAAMYHAKQAGRDNYQFFAAAMNVSAALRLELENDLHRALERDELLLHYQPRVDLDHGTVRGLEALIRWQHPRRGLLPPGAFVPLAEETGLIARLGEWVLRETCRQYGEWQAQGWEPVPIAINLSPRQFGQRHIADRIAGIVAQAGVPPSMIEIEITESTLMQRTDQTLATLDRLHGLGHALAIDDFGIGYSSLAYLKRFPVDQLKIDQSFVHDIASDPANAAIVSAVVALADSLGLEVVAEGVETLEQLDAVRRCGCRQAQGFIFSPAVPAAEVRGLRGEPRTVPLNA